VRHRYYVSRSLITKDRSENSGGLRIPAAEIEQLVSSRVHRWLLDPGSICKSPSARLADASIQQRLVARTAEIGKRWPELPVARKRVVLIALIERIEVSAGQIDIRLHPPRLSALFDTAATSQGVTDDETETLSVPVRLRRDGREIRMMINGTDPFATAKPDARLMRLLLRGAPVQRDTRPGRRHPLCCTRPEGTGQPVPISRVSSASAISRRI
jgi:site-specific DNA recombinase